MMNISLTNLKLDLNTIHIKPILQSSSPKCLETKTDVTEVSIEFQLHHHRRQFRPTAVFAEYLQPCQQFQHHQTNPVYSGQAQLPSGE